jgi:cytochrome c553
MQKKLSAIILIALLISFSVFYSCNNSTKETTAETSSEDSLKAKVERGSYLANHVAMCMGCHSERDITKFALPLVAGKEGGGHVMPFGKAEGVPGEVTPPNITPFALKDWTDAEIVRAVTQGINKKGDTLFPLMPYHSFSRLVKDDIDAIVAYIRTLKPVESVMPARKLEITPSMFGPLPENTLATNKKPDPSDKVKYGEYLITAAICGECHTPMGPQGPDFSKAYSGGFLFDIGIFKVTVGNITPDSATGIGTWTEEAFVQKFKTNAAQTAKGENPGKFNTIMPWSMYAGMKEEDLKAIYAYLRTVPPITNKVEKWPK